MDEETSAARQSPQVFVSFSSADKEFARRFLARLSEQPLRVWIYEDEAEEIRTGDRITTRLQHKIDGSQYFIPIVSPHSLQSPYPEMEVAYALQRRELGRLLAVLPVVSHELATTKETWTGSYRELQPLRYRLIDFHSPASIEAVIHPLCVEMGVEYRPLVPQDPRLPFMDRFVAEVRGRCPQRDDYEIGIYRRLMAILNQFSAVYDTGDFDRASRIMHYFCLMCEHEFPPPPLYYANVVKGVCEIMAGRISEARQTFESLLNNPRHDESTYGALGWIFQHEGDHATALEYYREALRRHPGDPAARTGVAINAVMCGEVEDIDILLGDIDPATIPFEEDRVTVQSVRAFALAHAGRWREAAEAFADLIDREVADAATVARFARLLADQGQYAAAVSALEGFSGGLSDPVVLHHLATFTAFKGDLPKALRHFTRLVASYPRNRQYRIDCAQIHWGLNDRSAARRLAASLFDRSLFDRPATSDDFYLDGFANWMLGDESRAEYDFERSRKEAGEHYRNLLPR